MNIAPYFPGMQLDLTVYATESLPTTTIPSASDYNPGDTVTVNIIEVISLGLPSWLFNIGYDISISSLTTTNADVGTYDF